MNNNVEAFKKYYANASKDEVIEDMFKDCCMLQAKIDKALDFINSCIGMEVKEELREILEED